MGTQKRKVRKRVRELIEKEQRVDLDKLRRIIKQPKTTKQLAASLNVTEGAALDAILALREQGYMIDKWGDGEYVLNRDPKIQNTRPTVTSDETGMHRFGVISDTHYGSKYAREDVCEDLYDWYAAEGLDTVYHCGNWIDGEARFNKHDLMPEAHGMQAQLDYFVQRYPERRGVTTHYVAGDDHEGWYTQREGVEIGKMLENTATNAGRTDLRYLGYKECYVTLEQKRTGAHTHLLVDHPGGGSAYADSYAAQKRVEALQSGEKPGIWLFGHWHKLGFFRPRDLYVVLAGCTKDQDPFARKKGLRYDIGGWIIEARQDPAGAIVEVTPRLRAYFDRGYHAGQEFSIERRAKRR